MWTALGLSFQIAFISTGLTVVFGVLLAYVVLKKDKVNGLIDGIVTLPMVLPPTVIGFFLLELLGRNGVIGKFLLQFDISLVFTMAAAVMASFIVSLPIMYRTTLSAFAQVDREVILSARTLGLTERVILLKLLIPLAKKGIISGAILSFARALGEFGATIMVAGNIPGKTQTISIRIYSLIQAGNEEEAYVLVSLMMGVSIIFMILVNLVTRDRKKGKYEVKSKYKKSH